MPPTCWKVVFNSAAADKPGDSDEGRARLVAELEVSPSTLGVRLVAVVGALLGLGFASILTIGLVLLLVSCVLAVARR
jgi:hypothetical protein